MLVAARIMMSKLLTSLASTTACPNIIPPTTVSVGPTLFGSRTLATMMSSSTINSSSVSMKAGYGTPERLSAMESASSMRRTSGFTETSAT
ncbi:hypothetical protein D3C76_1685130 [compost metagenome]